MVKIFHGHTNYRKLIGKCSWCTKEYTYMDTILRIVPLGSAHYRLEYRNDVIDFYVDVENEIVVPLRVCNIIEDTLYTTMVKDSKIVKKHLMTQADERLYNICNQYIFIVGREII